MPSSLEQRNVVKPRIHTASSCFPAFVRAANSCSSSKQQGIMETEGETQGAMASEWTSEWLRTFLLKLLGTAIGFVMVWPYVLQLVSSLKEALDRATAHERERATALKALQDRCVGNE